MLLLLLMGLSKEMLLKWVRGRDAGEGLFEGIGERDAGFKLIGLFVSFGRLAAQAVRLLTPSDYIPRSLMS